MSIDERQEKLEAIAAAAARYLAATNTLAFRPLLDEIAQEAAKAHKDLTEALSALAVT